jgi:hypothetical protein
MELKLPQNMFASVLK